MNKNVFEGNVNQYYHEQPGLLDPVIALEKVIDTGWESEIYIYSLTYGVKSDRTSVKRALRLLTGADFATAEGEYRTLSLLRKAGYPVPQVYELGKPDQIFEQPFIIMEYIQPGERAYRLPQTPNGDQGPLKAFVALFRQLHTLDWRPFVENPDEIAPPDQPFYHFDRQLRIFSDYFSRASFSDLDSAMVWLTEQREKTTCDRASVVHYDFHPDNILEDKDGRLYVIDWTSAEISDYRFDLAWTLTLALAYKGEIVREMILKEYEHQLGNIVSELDIFEAAAIVRRIGFVMLSLGQGAEKMGMRPETAEAMRRDKEPLTRLYARLKEITGLALPEVQAFLDRL
jgi:aminoglycoside phosphotransferase (APT) family kinase protein